MEKANQYGIEPFDPTELGFSVSQDHLDHEAARTRREVERLKKLPANVFARLHMYTSLTLAFGTPSTSSLPNRVRIPAEFHGFEPVTRTLAGTFPLLFHYVPFWVDPTGCATLSTYGGGNRWYLHTYFDDGSAVCTSVRQSQNANTEAYVVPDLAEGYPAHMRAVRRRMDMGEARPLARHTPELIRKGWAVYHLFQTPPIAALFFAITGYITLALVVWTGWTLLGVFGVVDDATLPSLWDSMKALLGI